MNNFLNKFQIKNVFYFFISLFLIFFFLLNQLIAEDEFIIHSLLLVTFFLLTFLVKDLLINDLNLKNQIYKKKLNNAFFLLDKFLFILINLFFFNLFLNKFKHKFIFYRKLIVLSIFSKNYLNESIFVLFLNFFFNNLLKC